MGGEGGLGGMAFGEGGEEREFLGGTFRCGRAKYESLSWSCTISMPYAAGETD